MTRPRLHFIMSCRPYNSTNKWHEWGILSKSNVSLLRIAMPPKHEKHNNVKARLYCMRVDVAVNIHMRHKYGQTSVWHLLCNSRHHPKVSRGALKVDRVRTKSSRPLHNPPSTRYPGHNVQNVCVCVRCTWRDECMRVRVLQGCRRGMPSVA